MSRQVRVTKELVKYLTKTNVWKTLALLGNVFGLSVKVILGAPITEYLHFIPAPEIGDLNWVEAMALHMGE